VIAMHGRLDLTRARREAKALLAAARAGDPAARARLGESPQLSDAQLAVARELGERSWPALVQRAEAEALTHRERARQLVEWATSGRRERAEALLALDPDLARHGLDVALVLGDAERTRAALARDPEVAARPVGARGWAPLLYVAWSALRRDSRLECARALIAAGADPNAYWEHPEHGPRSALLGAVDDPALTALLLAAGADPRDEDAVRAAAAREDPESLRLLLDAGADPHRTQALATALAREAPATVRLLLDHLPDECGERAWSLLWAIEHGRSEAMIRLLVERGADLDAHDEANDRTPYGLAIRKGRRDVAELLASLGAQRRVGPVDELLGACFAGDAARAERLAAERPEALALVRGAYAGALAEAAGDGRPDAVEILLGLGLPVDTRAESGGTALHAAARHGHAGTVKLLLAHGADPGKRSSDGTSALDLAADRGRVVELLAAAGTDTIERAEPELTRRDASEPDYAERLWAAEIAYLRVLATSPLVESRPCGDGIAVLSGIDSNTENGIVCSHADDATIAAMLAWVDAPAQWFVADPTDLRPRLVAAGATPERTAIVMGARLDRPLPEHRAPAEIEIAAVRDPDLLAAALRIVWDDARWLEVLASLDLGPDAPLQHRVALRDGRPVGAATTLLHGDTLYGVHLAVERAARRAGTGSALMRHVLGETSARVAVLGPTPETIAFYRLFGFQLRPYLRERSFYLP
jgi:ankyrin repeat protein/GNAT superfamily N-acetyltransferase